MINSEKSKHLDNESILNEINKENVSDKKHRRREISLSIQQKLTLKKCLITKKKILVL